MSMGISSIASSMPAVVSGASMKAPTPQSAPADEAAQAAPSSQGDFNSMIQELLKALGGSSEGEGGINTYA